MARGFPTKYKPEYCDELIEYMACGMSFDSFAGKVGVNIATVYDWAEANEEFFEAKKIGFAKCKDFWEKVGIKGVTGKIDGFNVAAYIFNMKNRFGWRDKVDIDITGKVEHHHKLDLSRLPVERLQALEEILIEAEIEPNNKMKHLISMTT